MKPFYYKAGTSAKSLQPRLEVIKANMVIGDNSVLDVGCIDGSMGYHLIDNEYASHVTGIDIVDKFFDQRGTRFRFIKADIMTFDIGALPNFDMILFLNVMHHLIDENQNKARRVLAELMAHGKQMIFDMGSMTESKTPWLNTMRKNWKDDNDMWNDILSPYQRKKLFEYEQRGGTRTMFLLQEK